MIYGKGRRKPRDEVLDAVDVLLHAIREASQRSQAAVRRGQTIRRLRSHGRSYAEILGQGHAASARRITPGTFEATIDASDRLDRAQVRALRSEGLENDRIAALCGISREQVDTFINEI